MSAESDLLFPQVDSFILSDFSNFSDYEDFSRDDFLMHDIDGLALLEDLDCKDCLKPSLMSELNEFSSSLEGIKEEDEEEDMHSTKVGSLKGDTGTPKGELRGPLQAVSDMCNGMCSESMNKESIASEAHTSLFSSETMLTSNDISCMSLEEDAMVRPNRKKPWRFASPFEHTASIISDSSESPLILGESMPSLPLSTQGDNNQHSSDICVTPKSGITQLSCTTESSPLPRNLNMASNVMHAEKRASINASIFHINSPLSSPSSSVSTPDGLSMLKMFGGHEENGGVHDPNASIVQPAISKDSALLSPHADAYHRAITQRVMQDGSSFATMHRSRSSHALGQLRLSGHHGTCPEESSVSSSSIQMPTMGYSSSNNFAHQGTYSPGLAERSPPMPMRRVFSTGDIQACSGMQICYGDNNLSRLEHVNSEESMGLKVGHYTLEERKLRLHRYRQKRNERNFSKKIKYACRKTLADSRPRIRGRFARTLDDSGEPLVKENGASYDDEYEEVDMSSIHCGHNRVVSFWNATGINMTIQHGH